MMLLIDFSSPPSNLDGSKGTGGSVAAKIDFTAASILAAGKLSNLGNIESTPHIRYYWSFCTEISNFGLENR